MKITNRIIRTAMIVLVLIVLSFAGFMVWDNQQVYRSASDVMMQLQELKPKSEDGVTYNFDDLLALNPDVNSWITLDGTAIDYPIVRGNDNWYYLNRDVFREFALAGSIYMDTRNAADYSDIYTLIYGHHMENHLMFGDLDLYKDAQFFRDNTTGTLLRPDGAKDLQVAAILEATETTKEIFDPSYYDWELSALCEFLRENAIHYSPAVLSLVESNPDLYQALALITCTAGVTGNRTVLICIMKYDHPHGPTDPDDPDDPSKPDKPDKPDKPSKDDDNPHTGETGSLLPWFALLFVSAGGMATITIIYYCETTRKKRK